MTETGNRRAEENMYSAAEMEAKVVNHLASISNISPAGINYTCSLSHDLSLDSLDKVELIMWCEMTFDVAITPNEEENIITVGDLINTVKSKKIG